MNGLCAQIRNEASLGYSMQKGEYSRIQLGWSLMPVSIVLAMHKAETELKMCHFSSGKNERQAEINFKNKFFSTKDADLFLFPYKRVQEILSVPKSGFLRSNEEHPTNFLKNTREAFKFN